MKFFRILVFLFVSIAASGQAFANTKSRKSVDLLISKMQALGKPKIEGTDTVAGKEVPALYFGKTKINNNFTAVDEVKSELAGFATIFVLSGAEFVRISTNVISTRGQRGLGTTLAKNSAYAALSEGKEFCGSVDILGRPYETCYIPIKSESGKTLGAYFTGYRQK